MSIYDEEKVITHDEARFNVEINYELLQDHYERYSCKEQIKLEKLQLLKYILQQEKKDERAKKVEELLGLYKKECKMIQRYINGSYQPMGEHLDNIKQIKALEKELEEMK